MFGFAGKNLTFQPVQSYSSTKPFTCALEPVSLHLHLSFWFIYILFRVVLENFFCFLHITRIIPLTHSKLYDDVPLLCSHWPEKRTLRATHALIQTKLDSTSPGKMTMMMMAKRRKKTGKNSTKTKLKKSQNQ
jgi:hypothetical protein